MRLEFGPVGLMRDLGVVNAAGDAVRRRTSAEGTIEVSLEGSEQAVLFGALG